MCSLSVTGCTYHVLRSRVDVVVSAPRERAVDIVKRQADLRAKYVAASPARRIVSVGDKQFAWNESIWSIKRTPLAVLSTKKTLVDAPRRILASSCLHIL